MTYSLVGRGSIQYNCNWNQLKRLFSQIINSNNNNNNHISINGKRLNNTYIYSLNDEFSMLPKRIVLFRHGESLGNIDPTAYTRIPDAKIPLTEAGIQQGHELGEKLKKIIENGSIYLCNPFDSLLDSLYVYCSPYLRTRETLKHVMLSLAGNELVGVSEEPRISGITNKQLID